MEKSYLIKQLELYSNTIVSFVVLQGLVYSYNFGTNALFNSLVKCMDSLSIGLVVMFLVTMIVGAYANSKLGKNIVSMSDPEHSVLVTKIYRAKVYVILYFGALPAAVTFNFGVLGKCS